MIEVIGEKVRGNRQKARGNKRRQRQKAINRLAAQSFKETSAYKKAFKLAMDIFKESKKFPSEEKYSLTDQIRKSSRSVCAAIAEAYRKRRYPAHFVSKISDADMENSETQVWLRFALACSYISNKTFDAFNKESEEVGRLLNHMINNPGKYV